MAFAIPAASRGFEARAAMLMMSADWSTDAVTFFPSESAVSPGTRFAAFSRTRRVVMRRWKVSRFRLIVSGSWLAKSDVAGS